MDATSTSILGIMILEASMGDLRRPPPHTTAHRIMDDRSSQSRVITRP